MICGSRAGVKAPKPSYLHNASQFANKCRMQLRRVGRDRGPPGGSAAAHLLGEMLERQADGVRRRLSEAADRGIRHDRAEVLQKFDVPALRLHELHRLLAADPAGGALSAALVLEEAEHVERG